MTTTESRVSIDSGVFVNVLIGGEDANPQWLPAGLRLLRAAEQGQVVAYISALTIAEVCGAGRLRGEPVKVKRRENIALARQWIADGKYRVVELDRSLAQRAAELAITHELKGGDAVVLASAIRAGAHTLFTWDKGLLKVADIIDGLRVRTPDEADLTDDLFATLEAPPQS